jgi:protein-S-isoprenylcysteine O-methyltransferase Ste14
MKSVSLSLILRNVLFTLLQPGIVAGFVPYLLVRNKLQSLVSHPFHFLQYVGIVIGFLGILIMTHCIIRFATDGQGTLSPADPTKRLVISGLYQYSRNPMYVGVMLILIGEAVFCQSLGLWVYCAVIFIAFQLFIVFWEEPRLTNDFGGEYEDYCRKVRRWV